MKRKSWLIGVGIVAALIFLFVVSVILAGVLDSDGTGLMIGDCVGVVEIKGMILDSKEPIKQLNDFRKNAKVKAVILRIDSPGGVVGPSQEIYEEVRKLASKKKVIVSMGSVAASGGYYIAAPATRIFANPGTVTGSIGVLMKVSNIEGLIGKIGLKSFVLKSGKFKDAGSPLRPMTKEDQALMQGIIDNLHGQFVKAVADGRKLPVKQVAGIADGRIFTGEQALRLKLVDRIGNLQDAIAEAGKMSGIQGEPEVIYPPEKKKHWLSFLVQDAAENLLGQVRHESGFNASYEFEGL